MRLRLLERPLVHRLRECPLELEMQVLLPRRTELRMVVQSLLARPRLGLRQVLPQLVALSLVVGVAQLVPLPRLLRQETQIWVPAA